MTVTTIYADASDNALRSSSATYNTARNGANLTTVGNFWIGQQFVGGDYLVWEMFFSFNTAAIPDTDEITDAVLALYGAANGATTAFTVNARPYNFGASVEAADWVAGGSLSSLTPVLATLSTTGFTITGYNNFVENGTNLRSAINVTGTTYLILASSRTEANNAPSGSEYIGLRNIETSGTTQDPKIVITHAASCTPVEPTTTDYLTKLLSYSPIHLWTNAEADCDTAFDLAGSADGTYTGVTLNAGTFLDGNPSALYAAADLDNMTAALGSPSGSEITLLVWTKVTDPAFWDNGYASSDGNLQRALMFNSNSNNRGGIIKYPGSSGGGEKIGAFIVANGGVYLPEYALTDDPTDWLCLAFSWSDANNRLRFYVNGVQQGSDVAFTHSWAGGSVTGVIAGDIDATEHWQGQFGPASVFGYELTPTQIADLANTSTITVHDSGALGLSAATATTASGLQMVASTPASTAVASVASAALQVVTSDAFTVSAETGTATSALQISAVGLTASAAAVATLDGRQITETAITITSLTAGLMTGTAYAVTSSGLCTLDALSDMAVEDTQSITVSGGLTLTQSTSLLIDSETESFSGLVDLVGSASAVIVAALVVGPTVVLSDPLQLAGESNLAVQQTLGEIATGSLSVAGTGLVNADAERVNLSGLLALDASGALAVQATVRVVDSGLLALVGDDLLLVSTVDSAVVATVRLDATGHLTVTNSVLVGLAFDYSQPLTLTGFALPALPALPELALPGYATLAFPTPPTLYLPGYASLKMPRRS